MTPSQLNPNKCPWGTGIKKVLALSNIPTDECVLWPYSTDKHGYGYVFYESRVERTHRAAWLMSKGVIEKGMDVCHSCDNPGCVNLRHLFVGTRKENMQDCVRKGRCNKPQGKNCKGAKLTEDQVREIRSLHRPKTSEFSPKVLAKKYGVHHSTISFVVGHKTWKHLL